MSSGRGRDEMVSESLKGLSSGADSDDEDSDNNEVVIGGYTHTHNKTSTFQLVVHSKGYRKSD